MADKVIIAATGHRPNKLGGYGHEVSEKLRSLAISFLKERQPDQIISGMALGWDMAWAQAGISLDIPVIAAVPFFGQQARWPESSQQTYLHVLSLCEDVIYVCDKGYAPWKMQIRNEWMVDHSTEIAALWDGTAGGTGNCMAYVEKQNKPYINLWEKWTQLIENKPRN